MSYEIVKPPSNGCVGPPQVTLQIEEPRFAAPGRGLEKTADRLLQLLSRALARLDKTGPARVGLKLVFQQNGQTMGDVIGLDDVPVFLPKQANSSQYIATVIGDNLHRHANTFADRAEVSRDDCAVAASQHVQREHMDIVMVRTVACAA